MASMEPGLPSAIMRTLAVRPWFVSSPAEDFPIYSIEQTDEPDHTSRSTTNARIKVQTVREWKAGRAPHVTEPPFQLAVVPVNFREDEEWKTQAHPSVSSSVPEDSSTLLKQVFHSFNIPEAVLACFEGGKFQFIPFPTSSPSNKTCLLALRNWSIAWNLDSISGRVRAVLLWRPISRVKEEIVDQVPIFLEDIAQTIFNHHSAGLLAILLCLRSNAQFLLKSMYQARDARLRLESIIADKKDIQQVDELGNLTTAQHWIVMRAIRERSMTNVALSYLDYLLDNPRALNPQTPGHTDKDNLGLLQRLIDSHIAQITFVIEETNMNLSTIYNLTAQRDQTNSLAIATASREIALQSRIDQENSLAIANASKRIAEESRKDSRAMKMIAIVTMVYLPGTFVATAFSMGIFEWSASPSNVVSPRIWVYFLFTGVLTILTIGGFMSWTWWQERRPSPPQDDGKQGVGIVSHAPESKGCSRVKVPYLTTHISRNIIRANTKLHISAEPMNSSNPTLKSPD